MSKLREDFLASVERASAARKERALHPAYKMELRDGEVMQPPISTVKPMTIAVFLAESPWGDIDDQAMNKGLGGRETALVQLCIAWGKMGHDVYAFVPREHVEIQHYEESDGKVRWIPNQQTVEITAAVQPDLFVSWENAEILGELTGLYTGITAIEMQVAHLNSSMPVKEVADYICVLSEWAGDFIRTQHDIEPHRVPVFANGVDLDRFTKLPDRENEPEPGGENPYKFIYSSSPDRGLHHLLRMWPQIQDSVMSEFGAPAELHVCYGVEKFVENSRWSHKEDGIRALDIERLLGQPGVQYHGKIGQDQLALLFSQCDLMLYPADTMSPTETGCISIVEALASGTPVVTTNCDCIGPDYGEVTAQVPLPFLNPPPSFGNYPGSSYSDYIVAILDALEPEDYDARVQAGYEFVIKRDWAHIAEEWIEFFSPKVDRV